MRAWRRSPPWPPCPPLPRRGAALRLSARVLHHTCYGPSAACGAPRGLAARAGGAGNGAPSRLKPLAPSGAPAGGAAGRAAARRRGGPGGRRGDGASPIVRAFLLSYIYQGYVYMFAVNQARTSQPLMPSCRGCCAGGPPPAQLPGPRAARGFTGGRRQVPLRSHRCNPPKACRLCRDLPRFTRPPSGHPSTCKRARAPPLNARQQTHRRRRRRTIYICKGLLRPALRRRPLLLRGAAAGAPFLSGRQARGAAAPPARRPRPFLLLVPRPGVRAPPARRTSRGEYLSKPRCWLGAGGCFLAARPRPVLGQARVWGFLGWGLNP